MQPYHLRLMRPMPSTSKSFRVMVAGHTLEAEDDDAAETEAREFEFDAVREDDVVFLLSENFERVWTV